MDSARGWRLAKEKASHKIDVIVALAMAALGAVQAQAGAAGVAHVIELNRAYRQVPSTASPSSTYQRQFEMLWSPTHRRILRMVSRRAPPSRMA